MMTTNKLLGQVNSQRLIYPDQSLVTVGRLIRETCLMAGIWETSRMTRADRQAMT